VPTVPAVVQSLSARQTVLFDAVSRQGQAQGCQETTLRSMPPVVYAGRGGSALLLSLVRGSGHARSEQAGDSSGGRIKRARSARKIRAIHPGREWSVVVPLREKESIENAGLSADVSALWSGVHSNSDQARQWNTDASLFAIVRSQIGVREAGCARAVPRRALAPMEGRQGHASRVCVRAGSRPSDLSGKQAEVRRRASAGNGASIGAIFEPGRTGASQERRPRRQPTEELGTMGKAAATGPEGARAEALPDLYVPFGEGVTA
jgi:hypothetical protein